MCSLQASSGYFTWGHWYHQGTWKVWPLPGFWCQLALAGFPWLALLVCSQNGRIWYTIFLPTVYGENHHCHAKYLGGIPVVLDKKIKRRCQSLAWNQDVGELFDFKAYFGSVKNFMGGLSPAPRGPNSFPESLSRFCCGAGAHAGEESHSRLENIEDGRETLALETLSFWQHSCKPLVALGLLLLRLHPL